MLLYVLLLANVAAIFFSLAAHFCFQFNLFQYLIFIDRDVTSCFSFALYANPSHTRIQGHSRGVFRGPGIWALLGTLHHPHFFDKPVSASDTSAKAPLC